MVQKPSFMGRKKFVVFFILLLIVSVATNSHAQSGLKRVQMGSSSTNVSFLALYTALNRGFFKEEGIDLEIVFMPANLASTAVLNGDLDYNGAVTGTIGAAVQGRPMKVLLFTVSKPLLFLIGQKNIKDLKQLKGKKIAGSSPGGSATLLANQALKQIGLEPGKDVSVLQMSGNAASRYAVLESGVVDASLLSVPENIIAHEKGYNELLFHRRCGRVSAERFWHPRETYSRESRRSLSDGPRNAARPAIYMG